MIIVTFSSPLFVLASMNWSEKHLMDYELTVDANQTACSYLKQFHLKDVILSVCNRGGQIVLDNRLFLKETATIPGIPLNLGQWKTLERMSDSVNQAIKEATEQRGGT